MIIQHNMPAANATRQLNVSTREGAKASEKLSSGYKINRSADDAAGLKISEKMRSQIRGLTRASQNCLEGDDFTKVADGALDQVHNMLQRQRELLVQAGNDTNNIEDKDAIQQELQALSMECDRIFGNTEFNGIKVFKGNDIVHKADTINKHESQILSSASDTRVSTKEVWIPITDPEPVTKGPDRTVTQTEKSASSHFGGDEKLVVENENGHHVYYEDDVTVTESLMEVKTEDTTVTYQKIDNAKYKTLKSPQVAMANRNGYLKVATEQGNLELSCAMTQLGLKIDGQLQAPGDINIYSNYTSVETLQGDSVINEYDMGNGITLRQTVTLSNNDTYKIAYDVINNDTQSHTVDLRLAFDTMNMPGGFQTIAKSSTTNFADKLKTDKAGIDISANADSGALGDIGNLYGNWDGNSIVDGTTTSHHTGIGFWWENKPIPNDGQAKPIGEVTYGPIKITSNPYRETTTIDSVTTLEHQIDVAGSYRFFTPHYLDIQAGANSGENIAIRQWDLSSSYLHIAPGTDISAYHTDDSLLRMDNAINKISAIRSYYGATSNQLNYASSVDLNTSENTQHAESRIRDTDMAAMMVAFSKYNILQQAGQSMLAQANQTPQNTIKLLQQQ